MNKKHVDQLLNLGACENAVDYAGQFDSLQAAWDSCKRGDWMMWLLGRTSGAPESESRKKLVLIACECARLALKHVPTDEKQPLIAIETAEKWARGENGITLKDMRAAANAAADAATTFAADAAAYAAITTITALATAAATAAYAAAATAYTVAAADAAAVSVAAANDAAAAHERTLEQCADIIRLRNPTAPEL